MNEGDGYSTGANYWQHDFPSPFLEGRKAHNIETQT